MERNENTINKPRGELRNGPRKQNSDPLPLVAFRIPISDFRFRISRISGISDFYKSILQAVESFYS